MSEAGKRAAAIAAAAAVALAAGCGGSDRLSKSDYEQRVKSAVTKLVGGLVSAGSCDEALQQTAETGKGDLKALASYAGSLQRGGEKAADEIDSLRPPKDAEADNQAIADTLHRAADTWGQVKKAAESGNQRKVRESFQELRRNSGISAYVDDLEKSGYDIGLLGSEAPNPCD